MVQKETKAADREPFRFTWATAILLFLFTVMAIITLFPFYAITLASMKPGKELLRYGLNVRWDLAIMSFDNYKFLFFGDTNYLIWFRNSLWITIVQSVLTLFVSACVGYGFAMYNFKLKNLFFTCVLIIMMVPMEIIMLPLYQEIVGMRIIDTVWGVVLPFVAMPLPIFFFRQFLSGIPKDLLDAGRVDGSSEYGIFGRIMLPLMAPSFAAMGIFVGMNSWNGFLWPLIVWRTDTNFTLPIGLNTLLSPYGNNYNVLIAGSVFAIIPIIVLFFCFQRYFIAGMTAGSVKG
jgi:arabinosaccharide transport system permease protein